MTISRFVFPLLVALLLSPLAHASDSTRDSFLFADKKRWDDALGHAKRTQNGILINYIKWRQYKDFTARPSFSEMLSFLTDRTAWPDREMIWKRTAELWALEGASDHYFPTLANALREIKPTSTEAVSSRNALLRHIWLEGEFIGIEQEQLLSQFGSIITGDDIARRADHLIWNEKITVARPLISSMPLAMQKLAQARIALITNAPNANALIAAVPAQYQQHPALQYERMRWRKRKNLDLGVKEILLAAPETVPYPEKWWPARAVQVRNAIEARQYRDALALLRNHGQTSGAPLADALWLRGWVQMSFLNNPAEAYKDFYALHKHVSYPVSLSRGAYWAGRAATRNGNAQIATNWYNIASKHGTTFYGQLAAMELRPNAPLTIHFDAQGGSVSSLNGDDQALLGLIRLLDKYDQRYSVEKFLTHLATRQSRPEQFAALGSFAREIGYPHMSVRVGKIAAQEKGLAVQQVSHPYLTAGNALPIEKSLAMAISRQESEFNPKAKSPANATGLMQLLPSTAQAVARQHKIPYNVSRLNDPVYNMQLGSHYLYSLIQRYDGRYPLAIAAYNAGPGNVDKWVAKFGYPPSDQEGLLNWLERIPFAETRNYVQRVLENLQVYRVILKDNKPLTEKRMFGRG